MDRVIYRKESGDVVAFFPDHEANRGMIVCYAHIGQHSEASIEYYHSTLPAKPEEYASLHNELCSIYTDGLTVAKRR